MATSSKASVCGSSVAGIMGQNPAGLWMSVFWECSMMSGTGLCDGLIPRPEGSYRLRCLTECDQVQYNYSAYVEQSEYKERKTAIPI